MAAKRIADPLLHLGDELTEVEQWMLAGGEVTVCTRRSPCKQDERRNEDSVGLFPVGEGAAVIVVADGCGGMPRGGEAADLTIQSMAAALSEASEEELRSAILDGVEHADAAIRELGVGAASTLVVAAILNGVVRSYHVGDSGLMIVGSRGRVRFQTVDHSPVGYGFEAGLLDEESALAHEDRNLVSNLLGVGEMSIQVGPKIALQRRDTVLVASDGLFDNFLQEELVELVRRGPLAAVGGRLSEACTQRMTSADDSAPSKPDDLSFVAFRLAR